MDDTRMAAGRSTRFSCGYAVWASAPSTAPLRCLCSCNASGCAGVAAFLAALPLRRHRGTTLSSNEPTSIGAASYSKGMR
eukprot:2687870-Rhodomonas_salina.2